MTISIKNNKLFITLSILSWSLLVISNMISVQYYTTTSTLIFPEYLSHFLLSLFYLFTFLSFRLELGSKRTSNFTEYLWQVFSIGAYTILISLFIKFFMYSTRDTAFSQNLYLINFFYHLNIGLITIFLANGFYVWKKMILYQKSNNTPVVWPIFEYLVYISILSNFFSVNILSLSFIAIASPLILLGLFLSFNLKWVAFLNYKQKWQCILFTFLIIVISSTFIQEIFDNQSEKHLVLNLADNVFILAVFAFILLNCFSSLLVLFFNLPTSSVFEQKFGEVMLFQKLSQSIQIGDKEEEVYKLLLDSSLNTVMADAGWLEIIDEKGNFKAFLNKDIHEIDVFELKKVLRKNQVNIDNEPQYIKNIKALKHTERLEKLSFKSLLMVPLSSHNHRLGTLVLLKNINDGFDKEMVDIIFTFVSQASIAIKNFRLISEAVHTERYKEELKIAREAQKSLLPPNQIFNIHTETAVFSKSSDEVGGDYYDLFQYSPDRFAIIIGDVSGKGTSAAFQMAQMKGIFQSLVQMNMPPDEFMSYANNALSKCLDKSSFITLALFIIDLETKSINLARAGHCLPLFYKNDKKEAFEVQSKGLGLGMMRNKNYLSYIEKKEILYCSGDILLLYTDGIIESINEYNEEFGMERLKNILNTNANLAAKQLIDKIIEELYNFTGTKNINDDYSILVVKFI